MTAAVALADPERLPFAIRPGTPEDRAFVMHSWLESERSLHERAEGFRYNRWQREAQKLVLAKPTTRVRICAPDDDPQTILGWAVVEDTAPPVVHYVFVRRASQRLGIARMLLGDLLGAREVLYTARPDRVQAGAEWKSHPVLARLPATWRFAPRAIYHAP